MGALDGLKILDFSTLFPGPYCTMVLGDMGADVLKVSAPGKKDTVFERGPKVSGRDVGTLASALYRNKKSIYVNLKSSKGNEIIRELLSDYDVLVEQFRPGVMSKFGLDYETLSKEFPGLIYCSITGYGQTGPMSMRAGHDINYLARSGLVSYSGRKGQTPSSMGTVVADTVGGSMQAIIGVLAAYIFRQKTGLGQHIDVSMLDGATSLSLATIQDVLVSGIVHEPEDQMTTGSGLYDYYETQDGRYFSVGAQEPKFFESFCNAIGLPELIPGTCYPQNIDEVKPLVAARFKERSFSEWREVFKKEDACAEPVLNLAEVIEDRQLTSRGMFVDVPFSTGEGSMRQLGGAIKFSRTPYEYKFAGNPMGFDTDAVLEKLGYSDVDIRGLRSDGIVA